MKILEGRVAAITGASSGIGRAVALELAAQGCHLALASRSNPQALAQTAAAAARHGVKVTHHQVDVAHRGQMHDWAAAVVAAHGRVHLIVNNAGVGYAGTVSGTSYADLEWVMGVNFWGVVHGTRAFLPHLLDAGEGHVVNVSSMAGVIAMPGMSAYHASKFAVRGYTESLRQELDLARNGVSATCVVPGGVKTNIVANARFTDSMTGVTGGEVDLFRRNFALMLRTRPEDAARAIVRGVRRNARRVLIGPDVRLADGMQRLLPVGYQRLISAGARLMGR
jgi:short-subunit dehydrogenase